MLIYPKKKKKTSITLYFLGTEGEGPIYVRTLIKSKDDGTLILSKASICIIFYWKSNDPWGLT